MRTSEKLDKILPALLKVKAKLQSVKKGTNNPFFKSKFADLNTHLEAVEPLLEENGLMLLQPVTVTATGSNLVSSIIMDATGQFVASDMTLLTKDNDMQKLGSAVTYARRYTLGSLLSMACVDDDGNAASDKVKEEKKTEYKQGQQINMPALTNGTSTPVNAPTITTTLSTPTAINAKPSFRKPKATVASTPVVTQVSNGDDL